MAAASSCPKLQWGKNSASACFSSKKAATFSTSALSQSIPSAAAVPHLPVQYAHCLKNLIDPGANSVPHLPGRGNRKRIPHNGTYPRTIFCISSKSPPQFIEIPLAGNVACELGYHLPGPCHRAGNVPSSPMSGFPCARPASGNSSRTPRSQSEHSPAKCTPIAGPCTDTNKHTGTRREKHPPPRSYPTILCPENAPRVKAFSPSEPTHPRLPRVTTTALCPPSLARRRQFFS